jgi:hypothetical protein
MEVKDWITIISVLIIVIGWFINSYLNRRHEISKKRLDYRLETLQSFLPIFLSISSSLQPFIYDKDLNEKIIKARVNFQLYGHKDEMVLFNNFVIAIESQDTEEATIYINKLIKLIRTRIRNELKLPNFNL